MSRNRRNASAPRRQASRRSPAAPSAQRDYGFQDWINLYQANWQSGAGQWPGFQMTYGKDPAEPIGPNFADYVVGGMQSNGVIFALEQKRIQIFSQVRYQFQGFNNGRPGKLFPKPNLSLVERPWRGGTTSDLNARMLADADLAGNNFLVAPDGDEVVRLRPDWVEIVLKARMLPLGPDSESVQVGFRQIGILYYEGGMYAGAKPAVFLPGEYSHFAPIPDPLATYRGMSWLTPVIREIQADTQATKHKLKFFENAATPNVAISLPKEITPVQFEAFVEKMDARHKGIDHAYETLYTGGGADVTVVGANMQQLDFKVTQGAGETRLAAAAGIHPVIVGLSEGMQGSSLNSGNYNAAKRSTVDTTFRHLWQNAAGSLEQLVTPPNDISRLWYDARDVPFLHEDQKDAADIQQLKATTITMYVREGFTPESAIAAVDADDRTLLVHTGLVSVQLQPPGAVQPQAGGVGPKGLAARSADFDWDDDPIGELDDDSAALLVALGEFDDLSRAFNAAAHPRNPKGSSGGGRFRSLVDRIKDAIAEHHKSGGKGDPFEGFNREQLRKVAKARGIELKRGEDRESIAAKLLADLGAKDEGKPPKADAKAAHKAADELPSEMSPEDVKARIPARFTVNDDTETGRLQGVRGLTAAQKRTGEKALYDYMAEDGEAAPSRIREPGPNKARDAIDAVMAHSATSDPVVVWRGLSKPEALFGDLLGRNMTGQTVHDPNFQSTSPQRDVAEFYAKDDGIVLRLEVPAGTRAVHLGHDDDEVLLDRGSDLKVLADTGPETRPRLVVVSVEQPPVSAAPPKAKPAGKTPPAASKFHLPGDDVADLARAARSKDAERVSLAGGESANTELVTTRDGRKFVTKRAHDWGDTSAEAQADVVHAAEAEQLAALVGRTIGAPVPQVYRSSADRVWMDWAEGEPIGDLYGAEVAQALDSRDAKLLGLLDQLILNHDRNTGNILVRNGGLTGIDHGYAWLRHLMEDVPGPLPVDSYRKPGDWFGRDGQWIDNPLTQHDVRLLRERLEGLRPSFEHISRGEWLDYTLGRLDLLAQHAKGTVDLIE